MPPPGREHTASDNGPTWRRDSPAGEAGRERLPPTPDPYVLPERDPCGGTDILVTDHSSLMFDFANTGRPMLFFTYDLEDYRDNLRGFCSDSGETAPGPLLRTSDEAIESIRGIDGVRASYAERYRAFVDQFCPLDDGKAASRVVERVFGELL